MNIPEIFLVFTVFLNISTVHVDVNVGLYMHFIMFKTRAAMFYLDLKPRGSAEWIRPGKTCAASFLNNFKNIPGSVCQEST